MRAFKKGVTTLLLVIFVVILGLTNSEGVQVKVLTSFKVDHPAFVRVINSEGGDNKSIVVSSFRPLGSDTIHYIPDANKQLKESGAITDIVPLNTSFGDFHWPNEAQLFPPNLLDIAPYGGFLISSGFLVPGKTKGGIFLYYFINAERNKVNEVPVEIIFTDENWFYHRAIVNFNMQGKGKNEATIVTCRAVKPLFGSPRGQLVLLSYSKQDSSWTPHILTESDGCDIFFAVQDLDNDGTPEIVATEYFAKRLTLLWTEDHNGNWLNVTGLRKRTVDDTMGAGFDVTIKDIDGDGSLEALVTNHQSAKDTPKGSMYLYRIPKNPFADSWPRKTLYSGFPCISSLFATQASPAYALPFYATTSQKQSNLPLITVAGDGAQTFYVFEPMDETKFDYSIAYNFTHDATVGGIEVADINNDGLNEIIVSIYEKDTVIIYSVSN